MTTKLMYIILQMHILMVILSFIFNKSNVIHTGDIFVNGRYPFIDNSSGSSIDGVITEIEKIISIIDNGTKIIPGHGLLSNLD